MKQKNARHRQRLVNRPHFRRTPLLLESLEDRAVPANIGYYDMSWWEGNPSQQTAILASGNTPVNIFDLTPAELAGIEVLDVQNPYGDPTEYLSHLTDITNAVAAGMTLVIHDRVVDDGESFLPGSAGFNIIGDFSDPANIDVLDNTTLVTNGPGGIVDNTTLDGGNYSTHGFAFAGTLPASAALILSTGDPTHIVTFSYGYGAGTVIYSSIPLDFYREFGGNNFSDIYAPNVLAYAATNPLGGLSVTSTDPGNGSVVFAKPTQYVVNVSSPLVAGTVDAADFQVNGFNATGYSYTAGTTSITFTFASEPVSAQGLQTMHVAPGAFTRVSDGLGVKEFNGAFRYDVLLMQVVSTAPAVGSVVLLPFTTLDLNFNEAYDLASAQTTDFAVNQGSVSGVAQIDADTLRLSLSNVVAEGTLTVDMAAGAMTDTYGNPGAAFSGSYILDFGTAAYPTPLHGILPPGSLIYDGSQSGFIDPAGDSDSFSILVDPNQTITVTVDPAGTLQPIVDLYVTDDNGNVLLASATAASAGLEAVLQTVVPRLPGQIIGMRPGPWTYIVTVRGASATTGAYTVHMTLNAAVENESHDGAANNDRATAQSLEPSFLPFNLGVTPSAMNSTGRGAALGRTEFVNTTVFYADFETGAQGFTVDNGPLAGHLPGQWHYSEGRGAQPGHSASHSFYYGHDEGPDGGGTYWLGTRTPSAGYLISPTFALPATGVLQVDFNYVLGRRQFASDEDVVLLQVNAGSGWVTLKQYTDDQFEWTSDAVDLTAYAGQTAQLRWQFDTFRGPNGQIPEGMYVDDVRIRQFLPLSDYYSFNLSAGESATVAIKGLSAGNLALTLANAAGTTVATGNTSATNVDSVISNYVASAAGAYYVRIDGTNLAGTDYSLLVTRKADFDTENNDTLANAQNLNSTQVAGRQWALGALSAGRTVTLNYVDSGWWDSTGTHNASNDNYIVGQIFNQYRDFFVFDLAGVSGKIIGAQLRLSNPFFNSPDPTETYSLFDVSTPISSLMASGSGQTAIFNDLGTGTLLATKTVSAADNFQLVTVGLGQAGLDALNAGTGQLFALGGAITTLAGPAFQYMFGGSGSPSNVRQLVLTLADTADVYRVTADALKTLEVQTITPAGESGEFVNNLDPMIRIYNASGVLVASDDNSDPDHRNAMASYNVPLGAGGTYYVEVLSSTATATPTSGEYILSVNRSTTPPGPPMPFGPLLAASVPTGPTATKKLTAAAAKPLLQEALRRWQLAGFNTSALGKLDISVEDLGGRTLGSASGKTIHLDDNAAGWGWFVDRTARSDSEFSKAGNQGEQNRMDLLTVLMHEVGHLLGQSHAVDGVMTDTLVTGVRRKPSSSGVL